MSAAQMRALDGFCLCDQCLSGPVHREPAVFIAAGASVWASHTHGEAGLLLLPPLPYKVGVQRERGAPRHEDTQSATKGQLDVSIPVH